MIEYITLGDKVIFREYSSCGSSSDSCHHDEALCLNFNGVWDGDYRYQNHSGSVEITKTIPNVQQNNRIYYALDKGWNRDGRTYTDPIADGMTRLYTIYDNDVDRDNNFIPFSKPDVFRIKVNGAWVNGKDVYVKVNGAWINPQSLYYKQGSTWINVY